jgi:pimeloyl-ACP methyl ester carboxylesterase
MATYVLIHGAGDSAFYWHLVAPELEERGSEVVAVDLPCEDESAGLTEYTDAVVEAIGDRTGLILVAQSFGAFTAPLICGRRPVELMVLVAGMVPLPGEKGDDWPANTAYAGPTVPAGDDGDDGEIAVSYHDVPPTLAAEALARGRSQAEALGREPWPLASWPHVPTRYLLCRDDRMFPAAWMRGVVRERLGIVPDEIDGGHCPALSRPRELADRLEAYRAELDSVNRRPGRP